MSSNVNERKPLFWRGTLVEWLMSSQYDTVRPVAEANEAGRRGALRRAAGGVATGSAGAAEATGATAGAGARAMEATAAAVAGPGAGGSGAAVPLEDLPLAERFRPVPSRLLQPRGSVRRAGGGVATGSVGAAAAAAAAGADAAGAAGAGGSGAASSLEDVPLAPPNRLIRPRGAVRQAGEDVAAGSVGAAETAGATWADVGAGPAEAGVASSLEDVPLAQRYRVHTPQQVAAARAAAAAAGLGAAGLGAAAGAVMGGGAAAALSLEDVPLAQRYRVLTPWEALQSTIYNPDDFNLDYEFNLSESEDEEVHPRGLATATAILPSLPQSRMMEVLQTAPALPGTVAEPATAAQAGGGMAALLAPEVQAGATEHSMAARPATAAQAGGGAAAGTGVAPSLEDWAVSRGLVTPDEFRQMTAARAQAAGYAAATAQVPAPAQLGGAAARPAAVGRGAAPAHAPWQPAPWRMEFTQIDARAAPATSSRAALSAAALSDFPPFPLSTAAQTQVGNPRQLAPQEPAPRQTALAALGRAMQVDPTKPNLKPPGTVLCKLKRDILSCVQLLLSNSNCATIGK